MDINKIFESVPIQVRSEMVEESETKNENSENPSKNTGDKQNVKSSKKTNPDINRDERTIFVGNVPLEVEKKEIESIFKKFGKIETSWFRSVPTDNSVKMPKKAKVILKKFSTTCKNKNCYIVFWEKSSKEEALSQMNNYLLKNRHLHVTDFLKNDTDFRTTVFLGNLHYEADEEEIREFFADCGKIDYVRVVRDKFTFEGKGFGYVKFVDKEGLIKALAKSGKEFKKLNIRVSKAKKHVYGNKSKEQNDHKVVNSNNYLKRKTFEKNNKLPKKGLQKKIENKIENKTEMKKIENKSDNKTGMKKKGIKTEGNQIKNVERKKKIFKNKNKKD